MQQYQEMSKDELISLLEASSKASSKIDESKYLKVLAMLQNSGLQLQPRTSIYKFEGKVGWIAVEKRQSKDCCRLSKFSIPLQEGIIDVSAEEARQKHWGNVTQKLDFTASTEEIEAALRVAIELLF